jgi:hypothetical protein
MAAKRRNVTSTGSSIPDWRTIQPGMKPVHSHGQDKGYERLFWEAHSFVHYEVAEKALADSFIKYAEKAFNKKDAALLKKLPDWSFLSIGKYTYMLAKGAGLTESHYAAIEKQYNALLAKAKEQESKKIATTADDNKPVKAVVINIQQRMREQVSSICAEFDAAVDDLVRGKIDVKQFDPYTAMVTSNVVKAAHAKIIKDMYQGEYEEAQEVVAWKDEQIKEGYSYMSAKMRKDFLAFYEKLMTACDTLINTGKATRKPRAKKAPSKEKLIARLKYKESDPSIGIASINPLSVVGATTLWVYNTKNRKLGVYVADSITQVLSVKGASIVGYDANKSTQKTVRKPEKLKGADKLPRTKMQKVYDEIRATETKLNGRLNEHTILLRVF